MGPLGLGTLIVKPRRHVTSVADLTDDEAKTLGPLLRDAAGVAAELVDGDVEQVYECLWSHAGGEAVHIHYVVQPVTRSQLDEHGTHGPVLQVMMFAGGKSPHESDVDRICDRARQLFA